MKNITPHQRLILVISSLSLIGFLLITLLKGNFSAIDISANNWSTSIRIGSLTHVSETISISFDTNPLLVITALIATFLLYKKHWKDSLLLVGTMVTGAAITTVVKTIIHSPRPTDGIIQETGYSFPSGHTTSTVVLLVLLTYLIWKYWKSSNAKTLTSIIFVAIAILVGFSRLYLNVHWLSDVLGGYLLGVFWATFSILLFQYIERTLAARPKGLISKG